MCWNKPHSECQSSQTLSIWTETRVTKVIFNKTRAIGVEYAQNVQSLDRTEHPLFSKSTNEGVKHHIPYNKWDKTIQLTAERLGAPVSPSLAFDYSRPYSQYIPLKKTKYTPKKVTACREVILATGAVGTAQILMLSGIGPKEHLKARSVPVIADLNVGRRVQDHQELFIVWKVQFIFPYSIKIHTNCLFFYIIFL